MCLLLSCFNKYSCQKNAEQLFFYFFLSPPVLASFILILRPR